MATAPTAAPTSIDTATVYFVFMVFLLIAKSACSPSYSSLEEDRRCGLNSDCKRYLPTAPGCQLIERRLRCVAVFKAALGHAKMLARGRDTMPNLGRCL